MRNISNATLTETQIFSVYLNRIGTQLARTNSVEAHNSSNIIVVRLNSILICMRSSSISARNKSITVLIYSINGDLFTLVSYFLKSSINAETKSISVC